MDRQSIDMDLIHKAKNGDQRAFDKLFNYYHRNIYNYVYGCIRNYEDAKDLTMVTFEKAFKYIHNYVPTYRFSTWLSRIAKNSVLDFVKYNSLRPRNVDILEFHNLKTQIDNPEEKIIHEENIKQMNLIINNMKANRKRVVEMRIDGLLCREIAEETNSTVSSVTGQLKYAKSQLSTVKF